MRLTTSLPTIALGNRKDDKKAKYHRNTVRIIDLIPLLFTTDPENAMAICEIDVSNYRDSYVCSTTFEFGFHKLLCVRFVRQTCMACPPIISVVIIDYAMD